MFEPSALKVVRNVKIQGGKFRRVERMILAAAARDSDPANATSHLDWIRLFTSQTKSTIHLPAVSLRSTDYAVTVPACLSYRVKYQSTLLP